MKKFIVILLSLLASAIAPGKAADLNIAEILQRQEEMENELRELRGRIETLEHQPKIAERPSTHETSKLPADPTLAPEDKTPEDEIQADGTHFLSPHSKKNASKPNAVEEETKTAEEKFKQARDLITARHYDDAKEILNKLVKTHARDKIAIDAYFWLGEIEFINGQHETAAVSFGDSYGVYEKIKSKDKTAKDTSRAANSLIQLARCLNKLGKRQQAQATLQQVQKEFSKHPRKIIAVMTERARKEIENRSTKSAHPSSS